MDEHKQLLFDEIVQHCSQFFSNLHETCERYSQAVGKNGKRQRNDSKDSNDDAEESQQEKKKRKPKKEVDPNAPKKPVVSAWILYYQDRREHLKKDYPNLEMKDINKMAQKEWHELPDEKKKPYVERAKKNNEIYKMRMNEYMKTKEEPIGTSKPVANDIEVSDKGKNSSKKTSNNYLASSDEENKAKANGDKKKINTTKPETDDSDDDEESDSDNEPKPAPKHTKPAKESESEEDESDDEEPKPQKKIKTK